MRIAFIADCHIGNHRGFGGPTVGGLNHRCTLQIEALRFALDHATNVGAEVLVVLGDLFEIDRPSPQVVRAVQAELEKFEGMIHILKGNHDMTSALAGDHALGPLLPVANIVDAPEFISGDGVNLLLLPFLAGAHSEELIPSAIESTLPRRRTKHPTIMCIHAGVRDDATPEFLKSASDSIAAAELHRLMQKRRIDVTFAGNWHERRQTWTDEGKVIASRIVQVGALVPTGFDNPGFDAYGWMTVFDSVRLETWWEPVPGPRFVTAHGLDEVEDLVETPPPEATSIYLRIRTKRAEVAAAREMIRVLRGEGRIAAGDAEVDAREQREIAARAGAAARSTTTLREALTEFVAGMDLPAGVTKARVIDIARGYLKV